MHSVGTDKTQKEETAMDTVNNRFVRIHKSHASDIGRKTCINAFTAITKSSVVKHRNN